MGLKAIRAKRQMLSNFPCFPECAWEGILLTPVISGLSAFLNANCLNEDVSFPQNESRHGSSLPLVTCLKGN